MHLQVTPIYYVGNRNEKSEDKAQRDLINKKGVAEVTTKEEGSVNMERNVKMKHCFEGEDT